MKVLIVDDHPSMLQIVREIVLRQFTGASTDTARNLREAIDKACGLEHPDMVVLDLGLPDSRGADTAVGFRAAHPQLRTLVLSADDDCTTIAACRKAGVAGYLPKTVLPETIAAALRTVANGGTCLPPRADPIRIPDIDLTQRQLEVLRLIAKGLGNKDIARSLSIAENTVKGHARDAYSILGVSSRVQAVRAMQKLGIRVN